MKRDYYSVRTGKLQIDPKISFDILKRLSLTLYKKFESEGYFQKHFGYYCIDNEDVAGDLGSDIDAALFLHLKKEGLWPVEKKIPDYSEDDLFDIIEFLHDHLSKPIDGYYHSYSGCGWHYNKFDEEAGRQHFRDEISYILKDSKEGYELSEAGQMLVLPDTGMGEILKAEIPTSDEQNIKRKDYDKAIWYRWLFNYYLNTIHALLRIVRKAENPVV